MSSRAESSDIPHEIGADAAREQRIHDRVVAALRATRDGVVQIVGHLRFLVFLLFLILAAAAFWLWVLASVLGLVRFALRCLLRVLLWIGAGRPKRPDQEGLLKAIQLEARRLWTERSAYYQDWARPVARHYVAARRTATHFWYWKLHQKFAAGLIVLLLVFIPAVYVVPRPQYVQVTDDNALDYQDGTNGNVTIRYLIHAVDVDNPGVHHEYTNQQMWWLGKINPQGLKSQLVPGRYYKFMIVGIRWYFLPTLYPNVISATETDEAGNVLEQPSQFLPSTRTGK